MHLFPRIFQILILLKIFSAPTLFSQGFPYPGPDDPAGDIAMEREGYMSGNRVLLYFQNTTELSNWTASSFGSQWSRWPNTSDGTKMLDGFAFMLAARVYLENDTIPVTSLSEIQSRNDLDTLYYLQTSYREEMDVNPEGTIEWGFYPIYGYLNPNSYFPAMSNLPSTWPTNGWPAPDNQLIWRGEWYGRSGRGKINADLETFFVVNDAQDLEYLGADDRVKYYPRPGIKIGDKRTDVSIQKGQPWGGIGLRVAQRGYQWNKPFLSDMIFWEYQISNISDYDLPEIILGFWIDEGIGGESDDGKGFYNEAVDLLYIWDEDGTGSGGLPTGTLGIAILETPGISDDMVDNDSDGLIDERRDNTAGNIIGPLDGITNLEDFLQYYNKGENDLRDHWDADEDQDWRDGIDINGNGVYDDGEDPGDDVGLDGLGPDELNYPGPDEGECNHRPDFNPGLGCEPNFNTTDVDESDMIGLTSLHMMPVPSHRSENNWFCGDSSMWFLLAKESLWTYSDYLSNLITIAASGPFTLHRGHTSWISVAHLHAYEPLEALNGPDHMVQSLFFLKKLAQKIIHNDYRYTEPDISGRLIVVPNDTSSIQGAIDMAFHGDTILVNPGEYFENLDLKGKALFLTSKFFFTGDRQDIQNTIIYGDSSGSVITCNSLESERTRISGFTLTNGLSEAGGGIFISDAEPVLDNMIIRGNQATNGAGIYCKSSNMQLSHLIITDNIAQNTGGAIFAVSSSHKNPLNFSNCLISNNKAAHGSGVGISGGGVVKLTNTTMTDLIYTNFSILDLANTIIWPDSQNTIFKSDDLTLGSQLFISYSDIKGGQNSLDTLIGVALLWRPGNMSTDPLFINPGQLDFRLSADSPCIDAGTDSSVYIPLKDLAGDTRLRDGDNNGSVIIDIGAYEYGHPLQIKHDKIIWAKPHVFKLAQNYPNPFNPATTIELQIPNSQFIILKIYDILGAEVATLVSDKLQAGLYKYQFDGSKLASGVYYYQVIAGEYRDVKKMILLR